MLKYIYIKWIYLLKLIFKNWNKAMEVRGGGPDYTCMCEFLLELLSFMNRLFFIAITVYYYATPTNMLYNSLGSPQFTIL